MNAMKQSASSPPYSCLLPGHSASGSRQDNNFPGSFPALAGNGLFSYGKAMRHFVIMGLTTLLLMLGTAIPSWGAPQLTIALRPFTPPFAFLSAKDEGHKTVRGYVVDESIMIGKVLGQKIRFILVDDLNERRRMLLEGKIDFIAHDSEANAKKMGVTFIPVGINLHHHLYVHKGCNSVTCLRDVGEKRTVLIRGAPYAPGVIVGGEKIYVSSPLEALHMLNQGAVDVFLAPSERVADYYIDSANLTNVLKKGVVLGEVPMGILVKSDRPELIHDLRNTINYLNTTGNLTILKDKWFGKSPSGIDISQYYKHIAIGVGTALTVLLAFLLWNVSLKRRVERVARDLRNTEQRYRDLIESSPDMIFLVSESGKILHANVSASTKLRLIRSTAELDLRSLVPADYAEDMTAFLDKVFHDGCDKYEFIFTGDGGQPLEVEIAGRIIQESEGAPLHACLFARDVTERNHMEEELFQSERLAIIGKMAASVAHEVNNPLGIIQANAEDLLYAGDIADDVRSGLEAIRRNAIRAGEITTGLLDLASPTPLAEDILNVEDLILESTALLGPKFKKTPLEIQVKNGPIFIRGDARSLNQVLVNLLLNARESLKESGKVFITAVQEGAPGEKTMRLTIKDTGKGIKRQDLSKVFEPFFTSRKNGFGLGLFITRRIIERHGGLVFAESEPGKGTSMIIELPAVTQAEK